MKVSIAKNLKHLFSLPKSTLYLLSGKKPIQIDNKTLDPGLQLVTTVLSIFPSFATLAPKDARQVLEALSGLIEAPINHKPEIENIQIAVENPKGKIPLRIFKPRIRTKEKLPVLVYNHGGGYVMGSVDSHEKICEIICENAHCIVVSVGYRLAPEYKFPIPVYDTITAYKWVCDHIEFVEGDRSRIATGGDSAGGTLATVLSHELKNTEYKPFFQFLIYPGTDASRKSDSRYRYGEGFFLTGKQIDWFIENYLNSEEDAYSPFVSPLLYKDFSNLPPAYIGTAGLDPILDDGSEYAEKLKSAGIDVIYRNYPNLIHGYVNVTAIPSCKDAILDACEELRLAFQK